MRILLADDEPKVRHALRLLLAQEQGLRVAGEARDAEDLQERARAVRPDAVLLDWELPGMGSVELLTVLRGAHHGLRVIALSGRLDVERAALGAGAEAFVSKTDPPERLLRAIRAGAAALSAQGANGRSVAE